MIMIIEYQGLCWGYTVSPFFSDIRILDMNIWAFMDIPTWMCIYIYIMYGDVIYYLLAQAQWGCSGDLMGISWGY